MFQIDYKPELSTDLEWMLQSGQVDLATLAEALVHARYAPVYRLCLALLQDESAALTATLDTFGESLASLHSYRSTEGLDAWLYRIALRTCRSMRRGSRSRAPAAPIPPPDSRPGDASSQGHQPSEQAVWQAFDSQPEAARLALLATCLLGLHPAPAARLLGVSDNRLDNLLAQAYAGCQDALIGSGVAAGDSNLQLRDQVNEILLRRWPEPEVAPGHLEQVVQTSLLAAETTRLQRRMAIPLKEILLIAPILLLVIGLIWGAERLLPAEGPEPTARQITVLVQVPASTPQPSQSPSAALQETTPTPTRPYYPPYPDEAYYLVQPGDTLMLLGEELGFSADQIRQLNRLPAGVKLVPGQRLLIPNNVTPGAPELRPALTKPTPDTPLSASSSPQEIRQRMYNQGDYWFSLWIDAIIQYHAPQGIIGADQAYRIQAWQYPGNSLLVYGPAGEDPSRVILSTSGELLIARPGDGLNWFTPLTDFTELSRFFDLLALLYADQPWTQDMPTARFAATGKSDQIAGRDAVIVEQVIQYPRGRTHYCIDRWTGVILCQKRYLHNGDESPYLEMDVLSISYDVQPPLDMIDPFLPWRGGYARSSNGAPFPNGVPSLEWTPAPTPQARPHNPLPAGYDLGQAQLSFTFPQPLDMLAPNQQDGNTPVFLYADRYLLGAPGFSNPMFMTCRRSPDGMILAYANSASGPDEVLESTLHWFRLDSPERQSEPTNELLPTDFAISPDSSTLAVAAFTPDGNRGLYLVDITDGNTYRLLRIDNAHNILWSPDGQELAFIGRQSRWESWETLFVISATSGEILHEQSLNRREINLERLPDWLSEKWGNTFPRETASLEDCLRPPGK